MFGLSTKVLSIGCGVLAAIVLTLGFLLKGAYEDLGEARAAVKAAVKANETNQTTISELEEANAEWAELHEADRTRADELVAQAMRERDEARGRLQRERAEWEELYADDPDADAWRNTRVPDAVSERLRRDRGSDRDADGDQRSPDIH